MSFFVNLIAGACLWLIGAFRFVLWLSFRRWYIPRDEFAQTLEYDSSILAFLGGPLRAWYIQAQDKRRQRSHRREWAIRI